MSSDDKLTFQCPACQSTLKVPVQMAGIQGPCPQCGTEIIAPNPAYQSQACLVSNMQMAGAAAGYGTVEPTYAQPNYAPEPTSVPAAWPSSETGPYNPWETPDASAPEQDAHGELNLGAALATPPAPHAPQAPAAGRQSGPFPVPPFPPVEQTFAPPIPEPPHMWAPQPAVEPLPPQPQAQPSFPPPPTYQAPAFPPQAHHSAETNPFVQPSPAFGTLQSAPEQPGAQTPSPLQAPSLFPIGPAHATAPAEKASAPRKGPGIKKRRPERERPPKQGNGRMGTILLGLGITAALGVGAIFLVPGLKDTILGRHKPLDVTVETALPVPPKPLPGSVPPLPTPTNDPAGIEPSGAPDLDPRLRQAPPALDPPTAATAKPAPDFGLGDPPATTEDKTTTEESAPPRALPASEAEDLPKPTNAANPPSELKSNPESFQGDSTASPEDVAAARTILEKFINAQSIEERLAYCQPAPKIEEQMRDYYSKHPTAPKPIQINYTLANILEDSTKRFFIFEVTTDQQQQGFPVAVEETDNGMRVDWRSFVEFHDNMLGNFFKVYRSGSERFRVILERAHYFKTDVPDLGSKLAFRIKPPIPGFEGYAFCPKDTTIGEELDRKFAWDVKYLPIVELEWTKDEKGAKYIKILRVVQDNWRALQ